MKTLTKILLFITVISTAFTTLLNPDLVTPVYSQYTNICNDPDMTEEELLKCENEYMECLKNPTTLSESNQEEYNECIGNNGCNSINRYTSYDRPEDCINWEENLKPGMYAYDWYDEIKEYCDCIEKCNLEYYTERDCDAVLDNCCTEKSFEPKKICFSTDMEVVIKRIVGEVEVQKRGEEGYHEAYVGEKLHMGDYIATGFESTCTVIFEKVAQMDIKEMTNFAIAQFFVQGNLAKTAISLRMGEVTTNVHTPRGCRARFEIETPTSTIGSRGTTFKVRYNEQTEIAEYFTYDGVTEVTEKLSGEITELSEGEYIYIDKSGYISAISDIPDYEELTQEEIDLFNEYEETQTDDAEESSESEVESQESTFPWVAVVCGCLFGLFLVVLVVVTLIFVIKRRKNSGRNKKEK